MTLKQIGDFRVKQGYHHQIKNYVKIKDTKQHYKEIRVMIGKKNINTNIDDNKHKYKLCLESSENVSIVRMDCRLT